MNKLKERLRKVASQVLRPKPNLDLVEWADNYRFLSQEGSSEPGRWRTSRVPYMAEPMSVISTPGVERIILMLSSQLGKTELLLNVFGYFTHLEPSPLLLIQPTTMAAAGFSRERIAPMIRDTPVLTELFNSDAYADSTNTILHKQFPGGFIALGGSNSPATLAGRPIKVVLLDEVDRFPISAKTEGDPVEIVRRRSQNFHDSKFLAVSTPTVEGESKIAALYEDSDQRKYHISCVHCNELFEPKWELVKWQNPEDALLHCPHCGSGHNDNERLKASQKGEWIASNPGHRTPGFHTSALVSPWVKLTDLVYEFVATENLPSKLQPFFNTVLGLPYKYKGKAVGDIEISNRVEKYTTITIPNDVILLTSGGDVQGDRIEAEVLGHTADGRFYNIDYLIVQGDTKDLATFIEFRNLLMETPYIREDGIRLSVQSTLIDSGFNTKMVYEFVKRYKKDRIFACKGVSGPVAMLTLSQSKFNASFYRVGVDVFKELLYNQLQITDPEKTGYCHFPVARTMDYFEQLCQSETRTLITDKKGRRYWHYQNVDKKRNEALDVRIYSLAAYELIKNVTRRDAEYIIKKQQIVIENMQKDTEIGVKDAINEEIYKERATINKLLPSVSKYAAWSNNVKRI